MSQFFKWEDWLSLFLRFLDSERKRVWVKGGGRMPPDDTTDPRPADPPFLFTVLLAARKAGDKMLESLARAWLAEIGIRVVFSDPLDSPLDGRGVSRGT
jgi:hypothetical protein